MKTTKVILSFTFIAFFLNPFIFSGFKANAQETSLKSYSTRKGTAIIITGAAARIPQEAALLEQLFMNGDLKEVTFISGASSGALNTVVLNAILNGQLSWDQYKSILYQITNNQVFNRNGSKMPLDTDPLRKLITRIVNDSLGYYKVGDLPFASSISATNAELIATNGRSYRFSNRKINNESNPDYNLVDILMASAAIPYVFPSVKLNMPDTIHQIKFIDGGIAEDHIPFEAARQYEQLTGTGFEKMIIVSRKNIPEADIAPELDNLGIKDSKLREKLGASVQHFSKEGFIKKLVYLQVSDPELAARTFIYVPDFENDFPMLDFNNFQVQFEVSSAWAASHKPMPLNEYVLENMSKK
jgi:predicted acylesterase/phospholipase RssA